ncbi:MAG: hypothetical protein ACI8RZ_003151 [Myxococcota bacterium]|jgi:hypothetical protein
MQVAMMFLAGCQLVDRDAVFDPDGDGFEWPTDCDSEDPDVNPDAEDVWYDGVDSDCDGASDFDADGDGFDTTESGGTDCDDTDTAIHPDAIEICSDGIDQDCDGGAGDCALSSGLLENAQDAWISPYVDLEGLGSALALADANSDGVPDLLIGASASQQGNGAVYITFGPMSITDAAIPAAVRILGVEKSAAGLALSAGSADDDGIDDMVVLGASSAWLLYGPLSGAGLDAPDGQTDTLSPTAVSLADGLVFIGDSQWSGAGSVFVFADTGSFSPDTALVEVIGEDKDTETGASLDVGDFDGDGATDLLVGAPGKSTAFTSSGKAYVVYGPLEEDVFLDDTGTQPAGEADSNRLGETVAVVGDLNGDSLDDYALSAPGYSDESTGANGAVYLVYEGTFANIQNASVQIYGAEEYTIGERVAPAGDVNADGYDDLLIGMASADGGEGRALLLYGPLSGTIGPSDVDVEWKGARADATGAVVLGGLDADLDGVDDIFIGSPGASNGSGEVSLILGTGL